MSAVEGDVLAQGDAAIIDECRDRYSRATDAESANRTEAITDLKFGDGDQWAQNLRDERFKDGRPYLTINLTDAMVRRVTNACRENRPRIKVHPVGDGADVQTAKVVDGLIRHIEATSGADYAYDTAVESAVRGGWGYIGIEGDYIDSNSFDQELKIIPFPNPFMCYMDPASRAPDGSDAEWFIESQMIKRTEYRQRFGHIDAAGWQYMGAGDDVADWSNKEELRLAKYWRIEREKDTLCLMSDGSNKYRSELPKADTMAAAGLMIVKTRPTLRRVVKCYLLTQSKILSTTTWPGKYIPRVPVYGRQLDINGAVMRKGMIRDLRDPARMYNYAQTAKTETYALQPKAPWLGPEGFMEGHEAAWRDANRKPIVALEYKPVRLDDGTYAPPPERQVPPQPNAGFAEWGESTKNDFLAVAGMAHDPGQDAKGETVSGIALRRRQGLADVAHYDFYDNLCRSLRHLGRIIVDLVPSYYDTPRIQRIIEEDGTPKSVNINEKQMDPMTQAVMKVKNDLTVGRYDIVVDTGPSYQTKREESAEAQLELLATPLGQMVSTAAGDLIIRGMDFPNADTIADRLQAMIPAAQMDAHSDLPPKAQTLIAGLQAQLKQANQKQLALELELQAKHGLEQMKQQGETQRVQMKEAAETERTRMELGTKVHDTVTKAHTAMHDTHVKAVTAHDVAEINVAGKLLDTHASAVHEKELAKIAASQAEKAEKRPE